MFFEQYDLEVNIAVVRFWLLYSGLPESAYADQLEAKRAGGYKTLAAMEKHLADGREWFVGESPTLADIALYGYTHVAHEGGFEMERFQLTKGWLDRVATVPGHVAIDA
jgi:glutathione S-transferase